MSRASSMTGGARAAAPLAVAVGLFGISYGVLSTDAGFSPLATLLFSATTFAGSAQLAVASVISAGGTTFAAASAALMLNARYLPIGISVARTLPGGRLARLGRAQLVVDESWAIGHLGGGRYDAGRLLGAGLTLYTAWVAGTALGLAGGAFLGDPETLGLDAAFPALFLALLAGQIRVPQGRAAALLGALIAVACVPLVPTGIPIVLAGAACLIGLRRPA